MSYSTERSLDNMDATLEQMDQNIQCELSNIVNVGHCTRDTLEKLVTGSQCINEKLDALNRILKELTEVLKCPTRV